HALSLHDALPIYLGAAAEAEDRVEHERRGREALLEHAGGGVGERGEGAARGAQGGGALLVQVIGGGDRVGGDALATQERGGVQPVAAVGAGAGEDQLPCGAAGPLPRRVAQ